MKKAILIVGVWMVAVSAVAAAGEIGFIEEFSLATNREAALGQLIPGTEDYYYYHCLHNQNQGQFDKVDAMLKTWIARHGRSDRVAEIENRQALLRYASQPRASLDFLIQRLNLKYNHQKDTEARAANLPTSLDPNRISIETLTQQAFEREPKTTDGFESEALDRLLGRNLSGEVRRHLLGRLTRPDVPNLVRAIADDLKYENSGGFGSLPIHANLLLVQLEELLKLKGDLLNEQKFVSTYLRKLTPNPDVDYERDTKVRREHLERLWQFVSRLSPAHNSLKAHVLYRRLELDRSQGIWNKDLFLTYLKLPRRCGYVNPRYLGSQANRDVQADLSRKYEESHLPPVQNDEPLVCSYLLHFFTEAKDYAQFAPYIADPYLKRVFAEAKIVGGIGDMDRWYSLIGPERYQALKDRVDIEFDPTCKVYFDPDEPVSLDVHVKNVSNLIVRVFEINAWNYYAVRHRPVELNMDLDGLVANEEQTIQYNEPPMRRVKRHFDFKSLGKRGVYIVEFVGNGKSSRALIQKGQLRHLVRNGAAGHVFTILDESNKKVMDASIRMGSPKGTGGSEQVFTAGPDGTILVPYAAGGSRKESIRITRGDFATLAEFTRQQEQYHLAAGFYVDRESLLKRQKATVIIRPALRVCGEPASLSVLEDVTLLITAVDRHETKTVREIRGPKLVDNRETTVELAVPDDIKKISLKLQAKVQNLCSSEKQDVADEATFELNGIDFKGMVEDVHLMHVGRQYVLEVLGRTGERLSGRAVEISLKHRDFREMVTVPLRSDEQGRIGLGELSGIDYIEASWRPRVSQRWDLPRDRHSYPETVHGWAGEAIRIPYMGKATKPTAEEFSLLEVHDWWNEGTFVADWRHAIKIDNGFLVIEGLPRGDYSLFLPESRIHLNIRVAQGELAEGYVLSGHRQVQVKNARPLQIVTLEADKEAVRIRLANAGPSARVHLAATRYQPPADFAMRGAARGNMYSLYERLAMEKLITPPVESILPPPQSSYFEGRDIGDEYQYILDRKYIRKYPGNMLARPGLLLNPWSITRSMTLQDLTGVAGFAVGGGGGSGGGPRSSFFGSGGNAFPGFLSSNLDFLGEPAVVLVNLTPDKNGVVTVSRKDLGHHQQVHVLAVDSRNAAYREMSLGEATMDFRDLRLDKEALDPQKHFTEQKQITVLGKGQKFIVRDIGSSKLETYDSLAGVWGLYVTLNEKDIRLEEFAFILKWPRMTPEEKRAKYSEFACHELNFFIYKKDPAFFETVVQPHLRNKKDKTFMDRYLLGEDLTGYLRPWAYQQLNVVERILLAQRITAEQAVTARHVAERYDLIPPDRNYFNAIFQTALLGRSLERPKLEEIAAEAADRAQKRRVEGAAGGNGGGNLFPTTPNVVESARPPVASPEAPVEPAAPPPPAPPPASPPTPPADAPAGVMESEDNAPTPSITLDLARRTNTRRLYRAMGTVEEWAENNYYNRIITDQDARLIAPSAFWVDYARHDGKGPFLSPNFACAHRNFSEVMLAMAVLDLPFDSGKHPSSIADAALTLEAGGPLILFSQEIKEAPPAGKKSPLLVGQNFFRADDRYRHEGNEQFDKFVTDEFLVSVVYGSQVVVTNPTSTPLKVEVLLQVPRGAIPVFKGFYTQTLPADLEPFATKSFEYYFYFPAAGEFPHYPVQVSREGAFIGSAEPAILKAVSVLSKIDATSWEHISQNGSEEEVIRFLKDNNIDRLDLNRIAWRMQDKAFFQRVIELLASRHVYHDTLWSYSLKHDDPAAASEYLQHRDDFVRQAGLVLDTPLLRIDPVVRKTYEHLEYAPLVNARAHKLGRQRQILNERFARQYLSLMKVLSYRPAMDDDDLMAVTYGLLLQDRVEDAIRFFGRVKPEKLATRMQYDYFAAYIAFYTEDLKTAAKLAQAYAQYPVDRWRKLFAVVASQIAEIQDKPATVQDDKNRELTQEKLAATEPSFTLELEGKKVALTYQNLTELRVNYYLMDVELLFSKNPFVQTVTKDFSFVRPRETARLPLKAASGAYLFEIPKQYETGSVMVEVVAGGDRKSVFYFANTMKIKVIENYGLLKVASAKGEPLARVYVKVYSQSGGEVKFYKDGYTDLRGQFDYSSLNTGERVDKLAILVLSETDGAAVREVSPPVQ